MKRWWGLMIFWLAFPMQWTAIAGEGSNLGSQATQYAPPILAGNITFGAVPSEAARIKTLAGQRSVADFNGDYQMALDAPGIYSVSVCALLNVRTALVEVSIGQTMTLDIDLGTPCEIATWPGTDGVTNMVACINGNQLPTTR